jgi:hypothetical protein
MTGIFILQSYYNIIIFIQEDTDYPLKKESLVAADEQNLQSELKVFAEHKQEWLRSNPGEFAVIVGNTFVGFYPDYETAFRAGLAVAGLGKSFLLKQVWAEEPVYLIC